MSNTKNLNNLNFRDPEMFKRMIHYFKVGKISSSYYKDEDDQNTKTYNNRPHDTS